MMNLSVVAHVRQHTTGANVHRIANMLSVYQLACERLSHIEDAVLLAGKQQFRSQLNEARAAVARLESDLWGI